MTKFDKNIGRVKPKHKPLPNRTTPKAAPPAKRPYGYEVTWCWFGGRRTSKWSHWFATEKQRDQSFDLFKRHEANKSSLQNIEKVQR